MAGVSLNEDTIAAVATPFGESAIGIVRLSGSRAVSLVDEIFLSKNGKPLADLETFSIRYGWIVKERGLLEKKDFAAKGVTAGVIDEVVVSLMRGPKSYTREDVVEISSHGGARALASILGLVLEKGARLAQPGEFTKRAFLNGRLDLAQAEAVLDIIQAKGELALKNSLAQLSGAVSRCITDLRLALLDVLVDMESAIDFSEEPIGATESAELLIRLSAISKKLDTLLEKSFQGKIIQEGLKVVIYGKPNVGKSSLLNALLKKERAIVTPIAGTTRDTIEEFINMKGLAVCLIDTAGILEYRDEIEREAVARAQRVLEESDLVLFVLDGSCALTEEDKRLAGQARSRRKLVVINKCDLAQGLDRQEVKKLLPEDSVEISALKGDNMERLEEAIKKSALAGRSVSDEGVLVSNVRHIEILKRSAQFLELSMDSIKKKLSLEFSALDLKKALDVLGELTGEVYSEGLLDGIFSKFCIGK
jgi:tRNA modification GTPase